MKLVLSCEHATNFIPPQYVEIFRIEKDVLQTHEAYDPGTLDLFHYLQSLAEFSLDQKISRLLIETNRSRHHSKLFSRFSTSLSERDKADLVQDFYSAYRDEIEKAVQKIIDSGEEVFHLSLHSFTPVLNSIERNAEIGLLYDTSRTSEKVISADLYAFFKKRTDLKLRKNYPYLGKADGFTTYLRKQFPEKYYGIELELNQKLVSGNAFPEEVKKVVYNGVVSILTKNASPEEGM